ncbi:hypothetical protein M405DRAFT_475508 [Rhizopogon salebrosus TDB-379]|nr:hypothetical protein M405DRAFT_475508 [Rhizopogon salebrosus TDB-379]
MLPVNGMAYDCTHSSFALGGLNVTRLGCHAHDERCRHLWYDLPGAGDDWQYFNAQWAPRLELRLPYWSISVSPTLVLLLSGDDHCSGLPDMQLDDL